MALNFRLSFKEGAGFTDLFPNTSMQGIVDVNNELKYQVLTVNIPVTTQTPQIIEVPIDSKMANEWVEIFLKEISPENYSAYNTITNFETKENQLVINRAGVFPKKEIQVDLIFYNKGVE